MTGKEKCNLLREIRKQIARANDIVYLSADCTYDGPCKGTCRVCDAEIQYLENALNEKVKRGESICLSGLSVDALVGSVNSNLEDVLDDDCIQGSMIEFDNPTCHYVSNIDDLHIDEECKYKIQNANINSLEDLLECSEFDLACRAKLDTKSINKVKEVLLMMGLMLKEDEDEYIMGNMQYYE